MKQTNNYALMLPETTDYFDVEHQNTNMEILDGVMQVAAEKAENAADKTLNNVTNADFKAKADTAGVGTEALALAQANRSLLVEVNAKVNENGGRIATLWDAVFNDITINPFEVRFGDLSGITLSSGVHNADLQRLEC